MSRITRTRSVQIVTASLVAGVTALTMSNPVAAGQPKAGPGAGENHGTQAEARGFYDARNGTGTAARAAALDTAATAAARPATQALQSVLGISALVDIDGTTGTPRLVARLNGYLTPPSNRPPAKVALGFVRAHLAGFGLIGSDLKTLHLRRIYRDVAGTRHLSWIQRINGDKVFGYGLVASVNADGRLLTIGGSPVPVSLLTPTKSASKLTTGAAAITASRKDTGEASTRPGSRDHAEQVLFVTRGRTHLAWRTVTMSADEPALSVIDAASGRVLFRRPLGQDENSADTKVRVKGATGLAFPFFPGNARGGKQVTVNYTKHGWLSPAAKRLRGNNSHTYSDVNDDNAPQASEEAPPSYKNRWNYRLKPFALPGVSFCNNPWPCSWDPETPYSWRANRKQNAAQVFYFVNKFHDHLMKSPIGFTEAAGNFQQKNFTGKGKGGDRVDTQTDDGANTDNGLPDGSHIDNANMDTPPDGMAPTMQMYLQHQPGTSYPDEDPFAPTNVGDEADTVFHEYTHGLSNRLVVDPDGVSSLGGVQAGSMGEAWSDWYAMDSLVNSKLQVDKPGKVDVVLFRYDGEGVYLDRTEPLDCKVNQPVARCGGGETGHRGGYTYADYAHVSGSPEVHSDGEIWAQTLWDLRDRLGAKKSEAVVTRAMELAPYNPSFLDMRNAILMADTAVFRGADQAAIWRVFAKRGMGFYAGSLGGDDAAPAWDRHVPPTTVRKAFITGTVTDAASGDPVADVPVSLAFQGGNSVVNPSGVTKADGTYRLGPVPVGLYRKLSVSGGGFDPVTKAVRVTTSGAVKDFAVRRDWAASSGGASIADFNGPDFSPACGPDLAIDGSQAAGWGSTTGDDEGTPTNVFVPKYIVVDLGQPVDVSEFAVDPSATCGDGGSASTGDYQIETSPDGTTWTLAAQGTFTAAERGQLNPVPPTAGAAGVEFVKFTILGNQTPDFATSCPGGAFSGCSYTDLTELKVYGAATP
ncbi:M36 family metallopeptidase [Nocardioides sp.]|uniref:M36 family metallopeptidase n=1 Tax=Nocardioides sp. TaxID=35761 RepID=UPI003D1184F9